jgi:hypothetical protein
MHQSSLLGPLMSYKENEAFESMALECKARVFLTN